VSTPGSPSFRRYLTPSQFGDRFGATPAHVAAVRDDLIAHGLRPGPTAADALSIPLVGTATAFEHAFSIRLSELSLPGRRAAIASSAAPAFSATAAGAVQAVVGLDTGSPARPLLVRPDPRAMAAAAAGAALGASPHVVTGGPQPCGAALGAGPGQSAYTADQVASAYGFSGLYGAGDLGAGVTVAVYELEPDDPPDIAAYQSCYQTHADISYVPVDGGAGHGVGAGEAALDIETLIGLAPDVTLLVYQGPNSNSGAPGSGPFDTFSAIINQDRARIVSVSWGQCEAALGRADADAESVLFEQAAIQGQSIVAASGDSGAEDCDDASPGTEPPQSQLQPAVDDPSSQPYVTGVGGTSLQALGPRPTETVWNSGGSPGAASGQPGAGGGGVSSFWAMPPAQLDAAPALNVLSALAAGSACANPGGYCREVPDVAANADPTHGYLIYWNGSNALPGEPAGWQGIGGTSAAAPVWAALLALTDDLPACAQAPVGYADPALYRAASENYGADFNDVTVGDNDFTGTNGGQFAAGPGYDSVTGLGSPFASALAADLCAQSLTIQAPGNQRSTVHTAVSLQLRAGDPSGSALTYLARGLPPGVKLDAASGTITGSPQRTGTYTVRVDARDAENATATATVRWIVGGAPVISRVTLATTATGAPRLTFTVTAGRNAPALTTLQVTVPRGLRLGSRRAVSVVAPGGPARLRFLTHVSRHRTATIVLAAATSSVRITLGPAALSVQGGRVPSAVQLGQSPLQLGVEVSDAAGGESRLTASVSS
jgi:subtilase family serine protease